MKTNEFTMFRLSKPYGYHPPAVEERIKQYETALREMNDKYQEARHIMTSQQQKIERLQEELREMHLEMSNLELPEVEACIEHYVLDDFKNYNAINNDTSIPEPPKPLTNEANSSKKLQLDLNQYKTGLNTIEEDSDDSENFFEIIE